MHTLTTNPEVGSIEADRRRAVKNRTVRDIVVAACCFCLAILVVLATA